MYLIEITYPELTEAIKESLRLVKEYSLACRLVEDRSVENSTLVNGNTAIEGDKQVLEYVRQIVGETEQWWYCLC